MEGIKIPLLALHSGMNPSPEHITQGESVHEE